MENALLRHVTQSCVALHLMFKRSVFIVKLLSRRTGSDLSLSLSRGFGSGQAVKMQANTLTRSLRGIPAKGHLNGAGIRTATRLSSSQSVKCSQEASRDTEIKSKFHKAGHFLNDAESCLSDAPLCKCYTLGEFKSKQIFKKESHLPEIDGEKRHR